MSRSSVLRARTLWRTWVTRGRPPRALPEAELVAVYRLWLVALLLKMVGAGWAVSWHFRWLRAYCVMWVMLAATGFPRSAVPFLLLAGALAVDLVMSTPAFSRWGSWAARPVAGAVALAASVTGGAWLQDVLLVAPPLEYRSVAAAAGVLAAAGLGLTYLARTPAFVRWTAERWTR